MRRREFIALVGGAVPWSFAARAQGSAMPKVGFLNGSTADSAVGKSVANGFRKGLNEAGYTEGKNVLIEYRWADGQYRRFQTMAAELVSQRVTVMFVSGGSVAPRAAMDATKTIPIVFSIGSDPVKFGFVQSLNRPGGNVTGVTFLINGLGAKRLNLLHGVVPATAFGFLINPTNPSAKSDTTDMQQAAEALHLKLSIAEARSGSDIDAAFASFAADRLAGLAVAADAFFSTEAKRFATLAAKYRIPAIYSLREFADAGGLISYGANLSDASYQAGLLIGRILKGAKPADLPVIQSSRFEFVLNLKTAKALGLNIPPSILAIADEVIE
jgi:putative tryptophan/tyrosine transport system substrate-binding protein